MLQKQIIFPAALLILASCVNSGKERASVFDISGMELLAGTELCVDAEIMSPRGIYIFDDNLLVLDKYDDKQITLVSLEDNKTERILMSGNGPHECGVIGSLYNYPEEKIIGIYDRMRRRYSRYSYANGWEFGDHTLAGRVDVAPAQGVYTLVPYVDGYIANGLFGNDMFCFMDNDFSVIGTFGRYPGDNASLGTSGFMHKNQTLLHVGRADRLFVAAGVYNDWLSFYREEDDGFVLLREYFSFDSDLDIASVSVQGSTYTSNQENDRTMLAYRALCSTPGNVYALYRGIRSKDKEEPGNKNYIFRFNTDGEYLEGYILDETLLSIAVDDKDEYLYAVASSSGGEARLMKYRL